MGVVIFGDLFEFPEGAAATNRVFSYAKGFKALDISVHVISFRSDYFETRQGIIEDIYYYYPFAQKKRSNSFIIRRWRNLMKYFNAYLLIKRINREEKILAIMSYSIIFFTNLFAYFLSRLINTKLIAEINEHPFRFNRNGILNKKKGIIKFYMESRMPDGIICISHYLTDLYKAQGVNSRKLFLVPSTVDPSRFNFTDENPVKYKYVGYFGSLTLVRDNIDLLINAFAEFSRLHPDIYLMLGGYCTEYEKKNIVMLIEKLNLQNRVFLLGFLTREEIAQYICNANILVMVRSKDVDLQASFPSKLTEFLASSKPVITVNVGEIAFYLEDGKDAFFVEAGNTKALAEKLDFVHKNPEIAYEVGQNGKQLTDTIFNYKYQTQRLVDFIKSFND